MKIAIFGAGVVGGFLAAKLAKVGARRPVEPGALCEA
jgi:ketopantoate reductase